MFDELRRIDSNFSVDKFKGYIDNIFVQILSSIMKKKISGIKHFVSDDVFLEIEKRVTNLENENLIQFYDELNVSRTDILSINIEDDSIFIKVCILSKYMDYIIDENDHMVSGHNEFRIEKNYYLTFKRKKIIEKQKSARYCPRCGSNIDVNNNGMCDYCGAIYNLDDYDFILCSMEVN